MSGTRVVTVVRRPTKSNKAVSLSERFARIQTHEAAAANQRARFAASDQLRNSKKAVRLAERRTGGRATAVIGQEQRKLAKLRSTAGTANRSSRPGQLSAKQKQKLTQSVGRQQGKGKKQQNQQQGKGGSQAAAGAGGRQQKKQPQQQQQKKQQQRQQQKGKKDKPKQQQQQAKAQGKQQQQKKKKSDKPAGKKAEAEAKPADLEFQLASYFHKAGKGPAPEAAVLDDQLTSYMAARAAAE